MRVQPDRRGERAVAEEYRRAGLHQIRERDVVDQRAADRLDAAAALEDLAPDQYGTPRGGRDPRARIVHERERVEHWKK